MSRSERLYTWYAERHEESRAQFAASGGFRLHWRQTAVDTGMSGADEYEASLARYAWQEVRIEVELAPEPQLSAHWWHG